MTHKYDLTEVLCCCILFPCFVFFVEFFLYMNKILPFQKKPTLRKHFVQLSNYKRQQGSSK